jgi:hypothetical protein
LKKKDRKERIGEYSGGVREKGWRKLKKDEKEGGSNRRLGEEEYQVIIMIVVEGKNL